MQCRCNLVTPSNPTNHTFKQLVSIVKAHYCPLPLVTALTSQICGRTSPIIGTLQLRSVTGQHAAHSSGVQKRLLAEPEVTFQKANDLCQASEVADKSVKALHAGQNFLLMLTWQMERLFIVTSTMSVPRLYHQNHTCVMSHHYLCLDHNLLPRYLTLAASPLSAQSLCSSNHLVSGYCLIVMLNFD